MSMATAHDTRDDRLATLLNELTEELHRGRQPDLETVCRQHPDLADEEVACVCQTVRSILG